jgi:predicted TIM-barrel fold metal-dependent hydrolase
MFCDVHCHCLPKVADDYLKEHYGLNLVMQPVFVPYGSPVYDRDEDIRARLEMMANAGVDVQVLSLINLPILKDEEDTVRVVRMANDAHAHLAEMHPDRFKIYAELPLPYLEASLKELARCRDELGIDSVNVLASHGTTSAVAEEFDPLFEEIDRMGAVVMFHPRVSGLCSPLINDYKLTAPLGPALEDTVLVFQMLTRNFMTRFPNIKAIIPHLGGLLPIFLNRMDNQMGRALPDLPERPSTLVRKLWFDVQVHGSQTALRAGVEAFGADRLLSGSDFPAMEHFDGYSASLNYVRDAGLDEADVDRILHLNAAELFGLG